MRLNRVRDPKYGESTREVRDTKENAHGSHR
jgi:hypothetical protein